MPERPQLVTPNSLLQQLPAALLGLDMSDPSSAMAAQYLNNWLKTNIIQPLTGISPNDSLWGATLYSNMTDFGNVMYGMNSGVNSRGIQNMLQLQAAARFQFLEGWQRTATTPEMFAAMSPEEKGGFKDYEAFIEHKTQGMMDNSLLTFLMQSGHWDPTGKMMATAYVKQASSNVARESMWRGDRDFLRAADAVANVFMDDKLELDYNKRDYGQMTMNESAAVLAAMTKNRDLTDFSPNRQKMNQLRQQIADGGEDFLIENNGETTNMESMMKSATQALRDRLKGLTEAMSPLKDFFGDDVPNMIKFLEELSGKSFSELDNGTVANLTRQVSNGLATGLYTADQMRAVSKTLNQSLSQMDTPFYMDTASNAIAQTMLTTVNAGITPSLMNDTTFRNVVSERTIRHAASPFANNINLAYSNWRFRIEEAAAAKGNTIANGRLAESEVSMAKFQAAYNELVQSGKMTAERAMLELSGAPDVYTMSRIGYSHSGYEIASKAGMGATMANAEALRVRMDRVIATRSNADESRALARVYKMFTDEKERGGLNTEGVIEQLNSWELSEDSEQRMMSRMYKSMVNDKQFQPLLTDLHIQGAALDAKRVTDRAEQTRLRTEFVGKLFGDIDVNASSLNDLIFNTLLGDRGQGMDLEKQIEALKGKTEWTELAKAAGLDQEDVQNVQAILRSSQMAIDEGMPQKERDKEIRTGLKNARQYITEIGTEGKARRDALRPYLEEFRAAFDEDSNFSQEEKENAIANYRFASGLTTEVLELFAGLI